MSTQRQSLSRSERVRRGSVAALVGLLMACLLIPTTALGQTTGGTPTVAPMVAATATALPAASATPVPAALPAPSLSLSVQRGASGTTATATGANFRPGETVVITFSGQQVASSTANTSGAIAVSFVVPDLGLGQYSVGATGQSSAEVAQTTFTITGNSAGLTLSNSQGAVNTAVAVSGTGYQAGETVQLSMNGTVLGSAQADTSGAFTQSVQVPNLPAAQDAVTATGQTSGFSVSAPFAVTAAVVVPALAPPAPPAPAAPPASAPVAAPADMTGAGYACSPGTSPAFDQGFSTLQGFIGAAMGQPRTCPYADPAGTGDTEQNTTVPTGVVGLAFWRKCANTDSFTDGYNHWAYTNTGVQVIWTGVGLPPDPPNSILSQADQASYATCGTT